MEVNIENLPQKFSRNSSSFSFNNYLLDVINARIEVQNELNVADCEESRSVNRKEFGVDFVQYSNSWHRHTDGNGSKLHLNKAKDDEIRRRLNAERVRRYRERKKLEVIRQSKERERMEKDSAANRPEVNCISDAELKRKLNAARVRRYREKKKLEMMEFRSTELNAASCLPNEFNVKNGADNVELKRKLNVERVRKYRERKKIEKVNQLTSLDEVSCPPSFSELVDMCDTENKRKLNAERVRRYRERKKLEISKMGSMCSFRGEPLPGNSRLYLQSEMSAMSDIEIKRKLNADRVRRYRERKKLELSKGEIAMKDQSYAHDSIQSGDIKYKSLSKNHATDGHSKQLETAKNEAKVDGNRCIASDVNMSIVNVAELERIFDIDILQKCHGTNQFKHADLIMRITSLLNILNACIERGRKFVIDLERVLLQLEVKAESAGTLNTISCSPRSLVLDAINSCVEHDRGSISDPEEGCAKFEEVDVPSAYAAIEN